jgi:hypothetical protein
VEQQVHRPIDDHAARHEERRAVREERRRKRREGALDEARVAAEVGLEPSEIAGHELGEARRGHAGAELGGIRRESGRETAVDENQLAGAGQAQGRDCALDRLPVETRSGRGEARARDRRDVGEAPFLLACARKAKLGEARGSAPAQVRERRRLGPRERRRDLGGERDGRRRDARSGGAATHTAAPAVTFPSSQP